MTTCTTNFRRNQYIYIPERCDKFFQLSQPNPVGPFLSLPCPLHGLFMPDGQHTCLPKDRLRNPKHLAWIQISESSRNKGSQWECLSSWKQAEIEKLSKTLLGYIGYKIAKSMTTPMTTPMTTRNNIKVISYHPHPPLFTLSPKQRKKNTPTSSP